MTDEVQAVVRVAQRVADGEPLTTQLMGEEGVAVPLRILLAAAVLTAADQPVNKKAITTVAPAARSAAYREHAALLDQVKTFLPALVQAQLDLAGTQVTAATLAQQLENANRIIETERRRRKEAEEKLVHVISYARELHWQLRPEHEQLLRERTEKVRHLRPAPPDDA